MIWTQANRDKLEAMLRESRETKRPIQYFASSREPQWQDLKAGEWGVEFRDLDRFRVQPAEEWRPLTLDEAAKDLTGQRYIKHKSYGSIHAFEQLDPTKDDRYAIVTFSGLGWITLQVLYENFTYLDGKPIGKKVG